MSEYNLCSLLVHSQPEKLSDIKQTLEQLAGTEVHASTENHRLIVTVEAESRKVIAQQILNVQKIDGVLSAAMIYQFSDDIDDNEFESVEKRMSA